MADKVVTAGAKPSENGESDATSASKTNGSASMLKKVLDGSIEKCKISELKRFTKKVGVVSSGDKPTIIWRIKCYLDGEHLLVDGQNPALLKGKVKKYCGQFGINCIGNQDELLEGLIEHLRQKHPDKVVTAGAKPDVSGESDAILGSKTNGSAKSAKGMEVAKRILELKEECDFAGILSVLGHKVTATSSTGAMRKAYLKISLLIHPDKLKGKVATNAFQAA